jgi:hypothetical protein
MVQTLNYVILCHCLSLAAAVAPLAPLLLVCSVAKGGREVQHNDIRGKDTID